VRALQGVAASRLLKVTQQLACAVLPQGAHRQACIESLNATLSATVLRSGM